MWKCNDNNKECNCLIKRDFLYVSIILILISIVIAARVFGNDQNAVNLFSFASTITSIILSVLAIFMTLISEYKNESTKNKLDNATNQIEKSTEKLVSVQNDLNKNLPNYQQVVTRLDGILERIQNIEAHTENIEKSIGVNVENDDLKNKKQDIKPIEDYPVGK